MAQAGYEPSAPEDLARMERHNNAVDIIQTFHELTDITTYEEMRHYCHRVLHSIDYLEYEREQRDRH